MGLALKLGFRIPKTLVSNNFIDIKEFVKTNKNGTICKPIFHGMFFDGMAQHAVYSRKIELAQLTDCEIADFPTLLQEEISRICDVRATFIGEHVFVSEIHSDAPLIDWRISSESVHYSKSSLDEGTIDRCRKMLDSLGLVYGTFDFIRSTDG